MSFATKIGDEVKRLGILLYSNKEDSSKVRVELDEESQNKIDKLQDKSIIDEIFLLGGKSVSEAVKDGSFERYGNVPIKCKKLTQTLAILLNLKKIRLKF